MFLYKKKKENRFHVVYEKNDLRYECNVNYDLTVWTRPLFITLQFYTTRQVQNYECQLEEK